MESVCDFCGVARAVVYCKPDSARLCLHCDGCVHSANFLSRRHPRSLLCDKCNSQPATARCLDEKLCICQGCDSRESGCSSLGHQGPPSIIMPNPNYMPCSRDQVPLLPEVTNLPKQGCSIFEDIGLSDGEDLCEGLNMDDIPLNFENSDGIFGCPESLDRYQFEDVGKDCLLMEKNLSVTESNGPIENAIEVFSGSNFPLKPSSIVSSSGQQDSVAFQSSCVSGPVGAIQNISGNANCNILINPSCGRNLNLGFPAGAGQVHPSMSLSLSNIIGESSAADFQDCGLSPIFLAGESPWESHLDASSPQARDKAKMRYNEKKKTRTQFQQANQICLSQKPGLILESESKITESLSLSLQENSENEIKRSLALVYPWIV
ncbi:hypothetical protein OIU85_007211 [Salix viminalis]|uniref:B box-type domain-containing protein n=1 Tax=Salix viminalis TaxID=40686 RepID=A0A9Q0P8C4_SALVM|nr:hypothetical protein OIU85_007211 [Salix viminalis]